MKRNAFWLSGLILAIGSYLPWDASVALAQRDSSSRGGDRGSSSSSQGGDRGGSRGTFGGGFGGAPGGGFPGGGFPGGDRGGDRGGSRMGGFGGAPGGFGGPPGGFGGFGGGSFSPMDMLRRFDRNGNNMLDPDETQGPARFFLDRMAQNNSRIDLSKPIPLDKLAAEMDRMRQERGGAPGMPGAPGGMTASNQPKEPEPLVPGFDKVEEKPAIQGFGVLDEAASIKIEERDLREAEDRIKRYDTNKDGVLAKEEITNGRWSEDPMQYDRNHDGRLSKSELAVRYAKRRIAEQGGQPGSNGMMASNGSRPSGMSPWGGFSSRGGGDPSTWNRGQDGGWGSRDGGNREPEKADAKKDQPKSYRAPTAKDKTNNTKGLPDWFARSDANGDGQVMMNEFSPTWSEEKIAEFARYDLNSDGIVTSRECLAALKRGAANATTGASSTASSTTSSSSSSGSPSLTGSDEDRLREWATKNIAKYDKNKDNQLTVDEWEAMIIKPNGADADGNGVITIEEYMNFNRKKK